MKGLAIVTVAALAVAAAGVFYMQSKPTQANTVETTSVVEIAKKDVTIAIPGDGKAVYPTINLKFNGNGVIREVQVKEGQYVKEGEVLARLDTTTLEHQVKQAEANYNIAVAKYNKLLAGPSAEDRVAKQVVVTNAETNLGVQQEIYDYKLSLYNDGKLSEGDLLSEKLKLEGAKAQLETAKAQLALLTPADQYDLASADESIKQAAANLAIAKKNLADATLTAPTDGVILAVHGNVGESTSSQGLSFIELGSSQAAVESYIIEEDISKISLDQDVEVEFTAIEGQTYSGKVTSISPNPVTDQSGLVTYKVTVAITKPDNNIKNGMTASANFISRQVKDVLTIPVEAVKRVDGVAKVEVQKDGTTEFTVVKTGLTDGQIVEIKEGLKEGDKVIIRKAAQN